MDTSALLGSDETLFRNDEVFNPDHIPDQFMFRDSQTNEMVYALKPAMRGGRPSSVFIFGQPATGKTTSCRLVFEQLKGTTKKIIPVYINCQLQSSAFKIFSEIRKHVIGMPAPDTGIPLTRVQDEVFGRLARDQKVLVVALDEFNYLSSSGIADDVLYSILRAHESYPGVLTAVFAVSTEEVLHKLDDKVRSIFSPSRIDFRPYNTDEIITILKTRRESGLYPNVISDKMLRKIASKTRDLRFGIELMKKVVLTAESEASKVVLDGHFDFAVKSMQAPEASTDKMLLLSLVRDNGPIESGKLFSLIKEQREISYSSFYRMVRKLESGRFLDIEHVANPKGTKGRTSIIKAV